MPLMIKVERKGRKWSQSYVAQRIGKTKQAVHYYETGKIKPSFGVLLSLECLFNMEAKTLFSPVEMQALPCEKDTTQSR